MLTDEEKARKYGEFLRKIATDSFLNPKLLALDSLLEATTAIRVSYDEAKDSIELGRSIASSLWGFATSSAAFSLGKAMLRAPAILGLASDEVQRRDLLSRPETWELILLKSDQFKHFIEHNKEFFVKYVSRRTGLTKEIIENDLIPLTNNILNSVSADSAEASPAISRLMGNFLNKGMVIDEEKILGIIGTILTSKEFSLTLTNMENLDHITGILRGYKDLALDMAAPAEEREEGALDISKISKGLSDILNLEQGYFKTLASSGRIGNLIDFAFNNLIDKESLERKIGDGNSPMLIYVLKEFSVAILNNSKNIKNIKILLSAESKISKKIRSATKIINSKSIQNLLSSNQHIKGSLKVIFKNIFTSYVIEHNVLFSIENPKLKEAVSGIIKSISPSIFDLLIANITTDSKKPNGKMKISEEMINLVRSLGDFVDNQHSRDNPEESRVPKTSKEQDIERLKDSLIKVLNSHDKSFVKQWMHRAIENNQETIRANISKIIDEIPIIKKMNITDDNMMAILRNEKVVSKLADIALASSKWSSFKKGVEAYVKHKEFRTIVNKTVIGMLKIKLFKPKEKKEPTHVEKLDTTRSTVEVRREGEPSHTRRLSESRSRGEGLVEGESSHTSRLSDSRSRGEGLVEEESSYTRRLSDSRSRGEGGRIL